MKNLLLTMTIGAGVLLIAGCVSTAIVEKTPPLQTTVQASASEVATPQMSPDVNFKASNAMPGGPGM